MGNFDISKDYYAVLEVPSNSEPAVIRKQYFKLAQLYHPDKNVGREAEYGPRFQLIGEAYDVLKDADTRDEYDRRRRAGTAGLAMGGRGRRGDPAPRGNPYKATSDYAPPPRRTGTPRQRTEVPPTAKRGANAYSDWMPPPPPPPRRDGATANQDARKRAEAFNSAFNGWQDRPRQSTAANPQRREQQPQQQRHAVPPPFQGQQRPVPAPPQASSARPTPERPRAPSNAEAPSRSAYEETRGPFGAAASQRKKSGFSLYSNVDEGTATGPTMYRTNSNPLSNGSPPMPPPTGTSPTAPRTMPPPPTTSRRLSDDVPFVEGTPKLSSRYSSAGNGERTYFDMRRTSSVQDNATFFQQAESPPGRRKSAAGPTSPSPYPYAPPPPPAPTGTFTHGRATSSSHSHSQRPSPLSGSAEHVEDTESSEDGPMLKTRSARPSAGRTGSTSAQPTTGSSSPPKSAFRQDEGARAKEPVQVRFDDTQRFREPMYRSSDPDMRASNRDGPPTFTATAPNTTFMPSFGQSAARSASQPDLTRFAAQEVYSDEEDISPSRPAPKKGPVGDSPPKTDAGVFRADEWEKQFRQDNWASKWANPEEWQSGTRPKQDSRRSRKGKPQPKSVEEEEEGPLDSAPSVDGDDLEAAEPMDVDNDPPSPRKPSVIVDDTASPRQHAPRGVYVAPSMPTWQAQGSGLSNFQPLRRPSAPYALTPETISAATQDTRPKSEGTTAQSTFTFGEFGNIAPFKAPGQTNGVAPLDSLKGDLGSGLPFPSQASSSHPFPVNNRTPFAESLPTPPQPLIVPKAMDQPYCARVFRYIDEYHRFYALMTNRLQQLAQRQATFLASNSASPINPQPMGNILGSVQPLGPSGILPYWISVPGTASSTMLGWDAYMQGVKDEEWLRHHLNAAAESYRMTLEKHEELRQKTFAAARANAAFEAEMRSRGGPTIPRRPLPRQ